MTAPAVVPFERQVLAERLTTMADGRRQPLEDLRLVYLQRLHRVSGDLAATEAIRTVDLALMLLPRPGRTGTAGEAGAGRRSKKRG